jgi:hypothetical protein
MLKSRFPVARPLALCVWLGSIAAIGFWGCQGPDTFLRMPGGGGGSNGSGGTSFGSGGHIGTGGTLGSGGTSGVGGHIGTGGSLGVGGRLGTGGSFGLGGSFGVGGARDGGADMTGVGGSVADANPDSEGGIVSNGTGPCMGLCAPATVLTGTGPGANNLGTAPTCHETTSDINFVVCGNYTTKVLTVNGTALSCVTASMTISLPTTKLNGGYCFQTSQGDFSYAYFSTYR